MSRWAAILAVLKRIPNPVKIIGALGALIGLILAVVQLIHVIVPPPKRADRSVLLVVDTSAAMGRHFGTRQTKLQAVKREILSYVRNQPDVVVGMRFVGSVCSEGYQPPTVAFRKNNEERIAEALDEARPTSLANLSGAVGQGANDFLRSAAGDAVSPSMWVFFGETKDVCGGGDLADEIANQLRGVKLGVHFDFFVVRRTRAGRRQLDRLIDNLKAQGQEAAWQQPRNVEELHHAVVSISRSESPSAG